MNRLNIIPKPNKIEYLTGEVDVKNSELSIVTDERLQREEYILSADKSGITITASCENGIFLAKQTLRQLGERCPEVRIEDKPAFAHRAFLLDTVRHYFSIEEIKRLIDAAASVKMNVMHWHITDDQGFRFFSKSRQEATLKGSVRAGSHFGNLEESGEYGGYYTEEQMRDIVDYCAERFITVEPEFDMPGHCSALIHAYPEIGCFGKPVEVKMKQGIFEDILCAGNDKTFETIFDILSDMLEIFPSKYIHIGGDEAPKTHWKECKKCQKRIKEEGLSNEEELQGWFTSKVVEFLESKGRSAVVWNESLKSGMTDKNVTVQMWLDKKKLSYDFADNGGRVIISDFFSYYCNYPYAMTPLDKTYNYSPVPKNAKCPSNYIGVEAAIWTEFINNFDRLCYMCFPRFTAVAETGWTNAENKDFADFKRRFAVYADILKSFGITPAEQKEWKPSPAAKLKDLISFFAPFLKK